MGSRYDKDEIKFRKQMAKIEAQGEKQLRKRQLKAKRESYKTPRKPISASKLFIWAIVLIVFEIIIWAEYEMHRLSDMSQAYALIGIVASLVPIMWGYFSKSKAENTQGGIVYDSAMKDEVEQE